MALGALILGGAVPHDPGCTKSESSALWVAGGLTLVTGYDYLRIGIKHMD